jgi:hypothetical protein
VLVRRAKRPIRLPSRSMMFERADKIYRMWALQAIAKEGAVMGACPSGRVTGQIPDSSSFMRVEISQTAR